MKNSRSIFLLLLANSISGVAQGISMLAIPWYFTGLLHSQELLGAVYFFSTSLSLPWGLYAGTLIDRFNRKSIFLWMNALGGLAVGSIALYGFLSGGLPWIAVAAVFTITILVYNVHFPNLYAFAQQITSKENYSRITSLLEIQGQITFTLAGGFAAILLKGTESGLTLGEFTIPFFIKTRAWTIYEIFALDAATYLVSFLIITRIFFEPGTISPDANDGLRKRIIAGYHFLKKHKMIFLFGNMSLLLFLTIMLYGLYVNPMYVEGFMKKEGEVYAVGDMFFSGGSLLAGFLATRLFPERFAVKGIIILTLVSGLMYVLLSLVNHVPSYLFANFVIGACNASVRIQRVTYMFHHIPNYIIGRTGSVFFVINVLLRLCFISAFTLPFFHEESNIVYAVAVLAAICFVAVLSLAGNYKSLIKEPEVR